MKSIRPVIRLKCKESVRRTILAVACLVLLATASPSFAQLDFSENLAKAPKMMTMEVNQAIMVTVELDFRKKIPSIAEVLRQIQRIYQPADGQGRTFAIIDAYGEPTPAGKLHLSMHVSAEKPGTGALVFSRTGEILWQSNIVPTKRPDASAFSGKNLTIYIDNGKDETFQVDGSGNPATILEAKLKGSGQTVKSFWPDGALREVTFIYSACGCPVKVMAKRAGNRTVRTKDQPVIFPDDPAAVTTIQKLMRW
ncbi:MAG: hypothetical protein ACRECJ_01715 [Limisphaerales bacterium]